MVVFCRKELNVLIHTSYIRGIIMSFIMFTTRLAIFLTVMYYISTEDHISAESVFVVSSYYQILRTTMTVYFPQGVAMVRRNFIQKYFINYLHKKNISFQNGPNITEKFVILFLLISILQTRQPPYTKPSHTNRSFFSKMLTT